MDDKNAPWLVLDPEQADAVARAVSKQVIDNDELGKEKMLLGLFRILGSTERLLAEKPYQPNLLEAEQRLSHIFDTFEYNANSLHTVPVEDLINRWVNEIRQKIEQAKQ